MPVYMYQTLAWTGLFDTEKYFAQLGKAARNAKNGRIQSFEQGSHRPKQIP